MTTEACHGADTAAHVKWPAACGPCTTLPHSWPGAAAVQAGAASCAITNAAASNQPTPAPTPARFDRRPCATGLLPTGLRQALREPVPARWGSTAMSCRYSVSGAVPRGLKVAMQRRHQPSHRLVGRQIGAQAPSTARASRQFRAGQAAGKDLGAFHETPSYRRRVAPPSGAGRSLVWGRRLQGRHGLMRRVGNTNTGGRYPSGALRVQENMKWLVTPRKRFPSPAVALSLLALGASACTNGNHFKL